MTEAEIRERMAALQTEYAELYDVLDALVRERIFRETGFKPGDSVLTWRFGAGSDPTFVIGARYVVADAWECEGETFLSFDKAPGDTFAPRARVEDVARTVEELNVILDRHFPGEGVRAAYVVEGPGGGVL